jgi:hypothetical protein
VTFCEVCQSAPALHWTGIICEACEDWLWEYDPANYNVWDHRHPYHGHDPEEWVVRIREIYRKTQYAETQENKDTTPDPVPPVLRVYPKRKAKRKAKA